MIRVFILGFLLVTGCKTTQECSEEVACGFTETCVDGACVERSCATSTECAMETSCVSGKCVAGCAEDGDCYPGDVCNADEGKCIAGGCRSTTLDCGYKEFCDSVTGECYEASGYYCMQCTDNDSCGGNGNLCLGLPGGNFCGVTCDSESDCPSAFTCVAIGDGYGNIISNQCIAYCTQFAEKPLPPPSADEAITVAAKRPVPLPDPTPSEATPTP